MEENTVGFAASRRERPQDPGHLLRGQQPGEA
jgi:hypothetical protein